MVTFFWPSWKCSRFKHAYLFFEMLYVQCSVRVALTKIFFTYGNLLLRLEQLNTTAMSKKINSGISGLTMSASFWVSLLFVWLHFARTKQHARNQRRKLIQICLQ